MNNVTIQVREAAGDHDKVWLQNARGFYVSRHSPQMFRRRGAGRYIRAGRAMQGGLCASYSSSKPCRCSNILLIRSRSTQASRRFRGRWTENSAPQLSECGEPAQPSPHGQSLDTIPGSGGQRQPNKLTRSADLASCVGLRTIEGKSIE